MQAKKTPQNKQEKPTAVILDWFLKKKKSKPSDALGIMSADVLVGRGSMHYADDGPGRGTGTSVL